MSYIEVLQIFLNFRTEAKMDFKTQRKVDVEEYFSMNEEAILTRVIPKVQLISLRLSLSMGLNLSSPPKYSIV